MAGDSKFAFIQDSLAKLTWKSSANCRPLLNSVPTLSVIAGPNGSGKSTFAASTLFEGIANLIDPDAIARHMHPIRPSDRALSAGRDAILRCRELIATQTSFAVETTLSGRNSILLMKQARTAGYRIVLYYVALSAPELHIERVSLRVLRGGHDIPDEDVRRRYVRSMERCPEALLIADEAFVFDNSSSGPVLCLLFQAGQITWQLDSLPPWVQSLRKQLLEATAF